MLTIVVLAVGQSSWAEAVTYGISGTTEQNGNVELTITASGDVTGTAIKSWNFTSTQSISGMSLPGDINLSFGSDKTNSLVIKSTALSIEATGSTGGYITLSHASKYIYHVTLKDRSGNVIHEAWNMTKSYEYRFQSATVKTIVVEYATAIPISDAVISGINASYPLSNAAVTPTPTVTWHGTTLTKGTHYTLSYQNNTSAGTATVKATGKGIFSTSTSVSKNYTLVWATYSVRFNKNSDSAEGTMDNQAFTYATAQNLTANAFTAPTGYHFDRWTTNADGTGDSYTDGQEVTNLTATNGATVDLYAQWALNTYTLRLHHNDGTDEYTDQTMTYDVAANIQSITRTGYNFLKWTTNANGSGDSYTNGQSVVNLSATDGDIVHLYAQWDAVPYFIRFIGNGHTAGTMSSETVLYDTPQNLGLNRFTRTGYTFNGWNTAANGTGTSYTDGQSVVNLTTIAGSFVDLYAQWTINTYTVHFEANGGTGEMADQTCDVTMALTANAFTRTGYTFLGWNTKADGTGSNCSNMGSIRNILYDLGIGNTDGATVTLYALWVPITYHITYDLAGGTLGTSNPATYTIETATFTLVNPVRTGYAFAGWTGSNGNTPETTVTIPQGSVNDRSYTANWTANTYTVTLDNQGATTAGSTEVTATYDAAMPAFTLPTRTGYTFGGYYTAVNGGGTKYYNADGTSANTWDIASATTLYAQWTPVTYNITYNLAGGTINSSYPTTYTIETATFTLVNPIRTGYAFAGWTGSNGNTPQTTVTISQGSMNDRSYTANWMPVWGQNDNADGSEQHPYIITTPAGLDLLAKMVNGTDGYTANGFSGTYFKLGNDITYTHTTDWNDATSTENNYTAIGISWNESFRGIFDGDGHTISGIRIYQPNNDSQGLFGYVVGGTVKNVTLSDARITGDYEVAGIAGNTDDASTRIENCLILNAAITAQSDGGVLVGYKDDGTYRHNYYRNCTVKVDGTTYTTNIGIGAPRNDFAGEVASVHSITLPANVTATGESVEINGTTYYASNTTITLSYSQAVAQQIIYHYNDGSDHALTGNTFTMPASDATVSVSFTAAWSGSGTSGSPYLITTTDQLDLLAKNVNGTDGYAKNDFKNTYFKLGNDITYTHTTDWNDATSTENNYTAIGGYGHSFQGTFDGDGHTISGIRIYMSCSDSKVDCYQGLFGVTYNGSVKNVTLTDTRITGYQEVGGIIGQRNNGQVVNCHVTNTVAIHAVVNNSSYHGGIVGYNITSTSSEKISNCTSAATISIADGLTGCNKYGGIAGQNDRGLIENCLAVGATVSGNSNVAAIVGYDKNGTYTSNYYHDCTVNGFDDNVGSGSGDIDGARSVHTLTLGTDITATGESVEISGVTYYASNTTVTLAYSGTVPDGYVVVYSYNDDMNYTIDGNSFTMPAWDVSVSAAIRLSVNYIDADGNSQTAAATPLTGAETTLGTDDETTWYVANSDISFDHQVTLEGDVCLILADDKTMTMTETDANRLCIWGEYNLTIYGQSGGTGALTMTNENAGALGAGNLTINGGHITATAMYSAISAVNDITINGGVINATSQNQDGIMSEQGNITINGGQVETTSIDAVNVILGYRNATDYITIGNNGCSGSTVSIATGKIMTDGTKAYRLTVTQTNDLTGKTLRPCFSLTLPDGVTASGTGVITQNSKCYAVPDATVTLTYSGTVPDGYTLRYTLNGTAIAGNTFTMPAADATVTAQSIAPVCLVESITVNPAVIEMNVGATYSILYSVLPVDATNKAVTFTSSDETVATVDEDGDVTGVAAGTATITIVATDGSGVTGTFTVTVTNIAVEEIIAEDITIITGETTTINYTVLPNEATDASVTFTSANTAIATVDANGVVTGVGVGETTITIASVQNPDVTTEITVTVTPDPNATNCIVLNDDNENTSILQGYGGYEVNVTLQNRTLYKDGDWNTLCLPFNATLTGDLEGATLMELDVTNKYKLDNSQWTMDNDNGTYQTGLAIDGTLYLYFKPATSIVAGTPYIIKWAASEPDHIDNPVFTGVTIDNSNEAIARMTVGSADGKVSFIGNYDPANFEANDKTKLFLGSGSTLYYPSAAMTVNAFRAYFSLTDPSTPVKSFVMNFDDERPTLVSLPSGREAAGAWYDLSGRRVTDSSSVTRHSSLPKGIYIHNGRKVVIK